MRGPGLKILLLCGVMAHCTERKDQAPETQAEDSNFVPALAGRQKAEIDATSRTDWVGLDLDSGSLIPAAAMAANADWDLAFKRTSIKMHGTEVTMQIMVDQDFANVNAAPIEGYAADEPATDPAAPETTGLAFHKGDSWYAYDSATHVVSSRLLTYVIMTNQGRVFKLRVNDYYNVERLPAIFQVEFQELKGPQS